MLDIITYADRIKAVPQSFRRSGPVDTLFWMLCVDNKRGQLRIDPLDMTIPGVAKALKKLEAGPYPHVASMPSRDGGKIVEVLKHGRNVWKDCTRGRDVAPVGGTTSPRAVRG